VNTLQDLERLVRQGEGLHLEFKRKANHPDRIVREVVAFLNAAGGRLLIGVDDDRTIYGCKHPDEGAFVLKQYFRKHCLPACPFQLTFVRVNATHAVLVFDIPEGVRKPYFVREPDRSRTAYLRVADMAVQASPELVEVLRHEKSQEGVTLIFGEGERALLAALEQHQFLNMPELVRATKLPQSEVSRLVVALVRARVVGLQPSPSGDRFRLLLQ
jgi:hypothetical protein